MLDRFKRAVNAAVEVLPSPLAGLFRRLVALRWQRWARRELRRRRLEAFKAIGKPQTVLAGPFQGMRYLSQASGSDWLPKLLGTHELELAPWIETACQSSFDLIIDVGADEGYYAVGMALRDPGHG